MLQFATADYSFPLLSWDQSLRLASDLGMTGFDLSLFQDRSQLKPEEALANPLQAGRRARDAVHANGMRIADVFSIPGKDFVELCPNHPEAGVRLASREYFRRLIDFATSCEAHHVTMLPGVLFEFEDFASSFERCSEELAWRLETAAGVGLELAVEAHTGSIISDPASALSLVKSVPGLTLTLDLGHFIAQGHAQVETIPLIGYTSHVHARCASPGRLQAPLKANVIDFQDLVARLTARNYQGWYAIEYVWIDWEHCNEVDNVSETILLKRVLEEAARAAA